MSEHLFTGSRAVFWIAAPLIAVIVLIMNTMTLGWTPGRVAVVGTIDAVSVLLLLGLYNPARFNWANRTLCAGAFVCYLGYFVYEWGFSSHPFVLLQPLSQPSPRNATLGLAIIGLPGLKYAVTGSSRRAKQSDSSGQP